MENQHRLIRGYTEFDQEQIDLMNEIKAHGEQLKALVDKIEPFACKDFDRDDESPMWVGIGEQHLKQGLMALTRAVAKPAFF